MKSSSCMNLHTPSPSLLTRCPSFHILLYFHHRHGQANTFIIFCSANKAVHWIEVLTPHNDPLSESHCSYTQDNYSTLQLERGNYRERCSSRVRREEKRGLGQGSCGCIVYGGRRSNKGPQLRQDAGRKMWCEDTHVEAGPTDPEVCVFFRNFSVIVSDSFLGFVRELQSEQVPLVCLSVRFSVGVIEAFPD